MENTLIDSSKVFIENDFPTKDDVLKFIADKASKLGVADSSDGLLADLRQREVEISTGLEDGFAIPHAKSSHVIYPSVLFIRSKTPIFWESFDDKDVTNILALLVPAENKDNLHLKMLSKLAVSLMDADFKSRLCNSDSKEYIAERILSASK